MAMEDIAYIRRQRGLCPRCNAVPSSAGLTRQGGCERCSAGPEEVASKAEAEPVARTAPERHTAYDFSDVLEMREPSMSDPRSLEEDA